MKINKEGLELVKSFEGLRLEAYKAVETEKYYTIGYGHYGADVTKGMKITQATAEKYLIEDLNQAELAVMGYMLIYNFNENQFSALVSFTYNCGAGNLSKLTNKGQRTIEEIKTNLPKYNKSGGKVLAGLTRRRKAELELFNKSVTKNLYYEKFGGTTWLIDKVFKAIGAPYGTWKNRKPVAVVNGFPNYIGSYAENVALVKLAKEGKLLKCN